MAILKSPPQAGRLPSHAARFMIDTVRGVIRVRKWPKRRGRPISSAQRFWVDWFRQANELAKYASAMDQTAAIEASKDSGFYPRDIILKAMRGRLYWWTTPDGWKWFPMAAVTDISDALDVVTQRIGSLLVRAGDRWRDVAPGAVADVLTHQGPDAAPAWAPVTGGGGGGQQAVPGTPITFDGTQSKYSLPVETYSEVLVTITATILSASTSIVYRLSTDGGLTYKLGANDYYSAANSSGFREFVLQSFIRMSPGSAVSTHWHQVQFKNLRIGRATSFGHSSTASNTGGSHAGAAQFDGPVTHIQIIAAGAILFNGGTLSAIGNLA